MTLNIICTLKGSIFRRIIRKLRRGARSVFYIHEHDEIEGFRIRRQKVTLLKYEAYATPYTWSLGLAVHFNAFVFYTGGKLIAGFYAYEGIGPYEGLDAYPGG